MREFCLLNDNPFLVVDMLPRYPLPALVGGATVSLPPQLVLMDDPEKEPIYLDPNNPEIVWLDDPEDMGLWVLALVEAYWEVWEPKIKEIGLRKNGS